MKLSIIIPVYNEENLIKQVIDNVRKISLDIQKEIIVVDDASDDRTRSMRPPPIRPFETRLSKNCL